MGVTKPDGRKDGTKSGKVPVRARLNLREKASPQGSYARLKATLDALPDLLFVLDRAGRIYDYHAPSMNRLYVPPEQFLGRTMNEVLPEPAAGIVNRAIADAVKHGHHRGSTYPLSTPAGNQWFEITISAQGDPRTDAGRLVAIVRDVTERKRTEEALRESEVHRRAINDNLPGGLVYQVDSGEDGQHRHLTFISKGVERLHGITVAEALQDAKFIYEQMAAEDRLLLVEREARAVATMTPFSAEVRVRLPSGEIRWRHFASAPRRLPNRHLVWDGIELDITDRKRAEAALQQAHDELEEKVRERTAKLEASRLALAESEAQFRQMAQNIQEAFWLMDAKTRKPLYVSPAFARIWNRPIGKLREDISTWFATIHPEDRDRVIQEFRRGMESGIPGTVTYRLLEPDGSIRWIEASGSMIRDGKGHAFRAAGVMRDITDHRRLEAEILNASEVERQRIGRDLHDSLGQSLTGIGYLADAVREELVRKSIPEAAEMRKLARLIGKTADQAHAMAQGLLPVDLKQHGIVSALQELAIGTQELFGIPCRYTGPADIRLADVNVASQLYRIAQEAATNAAKHAKAKRIEIRLAKNRKDLLLTVRDTGKGIFSKKRKGTGLGLDIMRYRADMIGATFWIDSTPDHGTTVNCLLPTPRPDKEITP